jgi:RNA polymerase sigma factor, sigma-70 family
LEDSKIIDLFFERSEQAIVELDLKYGANVKRTALNVLDDPEDAEECANDTYLGVWNSIPPQRPDSLAGYVYKTARNLAIKRFHSNTAKKRNGSYDLVLDEFSECIPSSVSTEGEYAAKELSAAVSRFLRTLGYDDRFYFVRRYWYADTIAQIAEMTGAESRHISARLYRTREKLNHYLKKEGLLG